MLLDQPILEGRDTYAILNKGIWRWPASSTPDKGGNTVLLGHRFTYTNPRGVFYFLNKVKVGDEVGVVWQNTTYRYKVSGVKVVPPTDTSILNATEKPTLTLYTCTPLWWPKDRLVITAQLENAL
jgi:sortase A